MKIDGGKKDFKKIIKKEKIGDDKKTRNEGNQRRFKKCCGQQDLQKHS